MRLSLLDWLDIADDDAQSGADVPWPIDLTRDIERGWPIHPADADMLSGAFNALGFLLPAEIAGSRAPDDALFSAIERFQGASGIAPNGSMGRGGMTILHLNKALGSRLPARQPGALDSEVDLRRATMTAEEGSSFSDLFRARRGRDARRVARFLNQPSLIPGTGSDASARTFAAPIGAVGSPSGARVVPLAFPLAAPALWWTLGGAAGLALVLEALRRGTWPSQQSTEQPAPQSDSAPPVAIELDEGALERSRSDSPPRSEWESERQLQRRRARADERFRPADRGYCGHTPPGRFNRNEEPDPEALDRALNRAGLPTPEGFERHHIVPGSRRLGRGAQDVLRRCRIGINDCENGVLLPGPRIRQQDRDAIPEVYHRSLGDEYYTAVNRAIRAAGRMSCDAVRRTLRRIRWHLLNGGFPP